MKRTPLESIVHRSRWAAFPVAQVLLGLVLTTLAVRPCVGQEVPELRLSLGGAVRIAVDPGGNTSVRVARESVTEVRAQSFARKADLVPSLSGYVTEQSRTTNLEAQGIAIDVPVEGFVSPGFVGPFETFDARARVTTRLLDWGAIERYRATRPSVEAAEATSAQTLSDVVAGTATAYIGAIQAQERVRAADANVTLAESLLDLADRQREAGTGTAIEVTRARVELANQRQALLSAERDSRRAGLELLRVMNLRLDTPIVLEDGLETLPIQDVALVSPIETAFDRRSDYRAQQGRMEAAQKRYDATRGERWPSLEAFADYGALGSAPSDSLPTRSVGINLRVPIFDASREAREDAARSELEQERIRTEEFRQGVELEVRLALDDVATAEAEVEVSREGRDLAGEELERARRRYQAGVTTNIEVVDAQARLERAREAEIDARARYHVARIELGRATGTVEEMIPGL